MVSTISQGDLGVTIDEDLKFHEHTLFVTNKANHILRLMTRSFACLHSNMLIHLYKSMVRPILEYANTIWGPYFLMDQRKVEPIQCRATKLITNLCESDYNTRLAELQLPSLNYGRQHGDVKYLYQTFNNLVDINVDKLFTLSSCTTGGHEFKLYKHHSTN